MRETDPLLALQSFSAVNSPSTLCVVDDSGAARRQRTGFFGVGSEGMPPWLPRLISQLFAYAVTIWILLALARALRGFLILLLISLFVAIALEPGVTYLANRGIRRGLATGVIIAGLTLIVSVFVGMMVPVIISQTTKLVGNIPIYIDSIAEWNVWRQLGIQFSSDPVAEALRSLDTNLEMLASDITGTLFGVGARLLSTVLSGLALLLFTFYLTADAPRLRRTVLSILPAEQQRKVLKLVEIAIEKTGAYFYSRALLAVVAAFFTWLVLLILNVDFALPLAIWVGLLSQFVPIVGTYVGGSLPVLIALLESPRAGIGVLIFIVIYQQIENYIISPRITARTMSLHPAIAFGAVIVGSTLLGAAGALMALPLTATLQAFLTTYIHRHELIHSELLSDGKKTSPLVGHDLRDPEISPS